MSPLVYQVSLECLILVVMFSYVTIFNCSNKFITFNFFLVYFLQLPFFYCFSIGISKSAISKCPVNGSLNSGTSFTAGRFLVKISNASSKSDKRSLILLYSNLQHLHFLSVFDLLFDFSDFV